MMSRQRAPARRPIAFVFAWALTCAVVSVPEARAESPSERQRSIAPTAAERARAQRLYKIALRAFDSANYRQALAGFTQAYELAPSFRIQYNIAQVNVVLDDPAAALAAFERYLREGGALVPTKRVGEVERQMAELQKRVALVTVDVDEDESRIRIDNVEIGRSPLSEPLRLNAGAHTIEVVAENGKRFSEELRLEGGMEKTVSVSLREPEVMKPRRSEQSAPEPAMQRKQGEANGGTPWLAWGITGALGVGTAVLGVMTLSAQNDEQRVQDTQDISVEQLQAARDKVEHLALATDVLLGATAIAAGVSLYLTLKSSGENERASEARLILAPGRIQARVTF